MTRKYDRRNFVKLTSGNNTEKASAVMKTIQNSQKNLRIGFIGIGGRGSYHLNCALGIEGIEVPAICELKPVRLYQAKRWIEEAGLPSPVLYNRGPEDYLRMIETENLDAVICCTPWEFHAPVCIAAMKNNKHAVSEVPLCITLDQAWEIVETYE